MYKPKAYRRDKKKFNPDYVPHKTAVRMMELLARYPHIRGTFFDDLLGVCKNTRNYHLNLLFNNRYIYKPVGQGNGYNSLNDTHIYANEDKAWEFLSEEYERATNLSYSKLDMPSAQFRHMMMICDMLQSIEIGLKGTGCEFITQAEILSKATGKDPLKFPATIYWNNNPYHTFGKPDAVFGIRYPNGKTRLFLVEAEHKGANTRHTARLSSTEKKLMVYDAVQKSGAIKQLGKRNFTVLMGIPNKTRLKNIKKLIEEKFTQSDLFLLAYVPTHENLYRSPSPRPELFTGLWERGGMEPVSIKETPTN